MKQYLLAHGIPEEHIIPEDQSKNTMDNLQNSKDIIFSKEGKHRVALVTSNYHVYRCLLYAKSLKMKCTGIGAPVAWYYWPSAVIREFAAVFTTKKNPDLHVDRLFFRCASSGIWVCEDDLERK